VPRAGLAATDQLERVTGQEDLHSRARALGSVMLVVYGD
jgi:hypothetical protein